MLARLTLLITFTLVLAATCYSATISSLNAGVVSAFEESVECPPFKISNIGGMQVTAAQNIWVMLPENLSVVWDSDIWALALEGPAAPKCAAVASYAHDDKVLFIYVTQDWAEGDYIVVSGLRFKGVSSVEPSFRLGIDVNNDFIVDAYDDKFVTVTY